MGTGFMQATPELKRPQPPIPGFRIGGVLVDPPILLAPMEDVTNPPFRLLCKQIGGVGMVFTEFVSALALHYGARKSARKMAILDAERPAAIQIFGSDPSTMADAARMAVDLGADVVDINMGCWVPKVCRTGSGAALLRDPEHAVAVARAVLRAVDVPVSVKVRAGYEQGRFAAPELARALEAEGVAMITIHARFATQGFDGTADWDLIRRLRDAVSIPLVGNGDVRTGEDALRMFHETGCDGVMVGRAAISNPWALAAIVARVIDLPEPEPPTLEERVRTALRHVRMMIRYEAGAPYDDPDGPIPDDAAAEQRAVRHLRGQLPLYVKGFPGAAAVRKRVSECSTYAEVRGVLESLVESAFP